MVLRFIHTSLATCLLHKKTDVLKLFLVLLPEPHVRLVELIWLDPGLILPLMESISTSAKHTTGGAKSLPRVVRNVTRNLMITLADRGIKAGSVCRINV